MAEYIAPPGLQGKPLNPISTSYEILTDNFQGGDAASAAVIASAILAAHEGEIDGWLNALRQQNSINPLSQATGELVFDDLRAFYVRNNGVESLHILATPASSGTTSSQPFANIFDVKCPFQGYPVGSILQQSIYAWAGWNLYDDTMTNDDEQAAIPAPWVLKIGKTGTCALPIARQQYWEVEIVELPDHVPKSFVSHYPDAVFDGTFVDCDLVDVTKISLTNKFPANLDTWLTPAVGLIPKQLTPAGLAGANLVSDDMLVGLDNDDTFQVARSIYVVPTIVEYVDVQTKVWDAPQYWINNPADVDTTPRIGELSQLTLSVGPPPNVTPFLGHAPQGSLEERWNLQCQILEADWNPIYIANVPVKPTITIGGGYVGAKQIPPIVRGDAAGIGVGGKYLLIPTVTLNQMPINAFALADIEPSLAAQKAQNTSDITALIALDAAAGVIDTYNTIDIAADPRRTGFAITGATPYLAGFPKSFQMVSETGISDDTPIPIDDNVFINGGFVHVPFILGSLGYQPGEFVETSYTQSYIGGDYLNGPGANFPANSDSLDLLLFDDGKQLAFLYEVNVHKTPPQGVNAIGSHTWAFKGRGDTLASTTTPTDDGPLKPPLGGEGAKFNGVWSGTDLEALKIGDILMFAVDATARKMWVGKNGKWYDKHGVNTHQPGDDDLLPSLLLDGDNTQDYYPAATLRVGPSEVKFRFGSACKFLPPGGFAFYGAPPTGVGQ